MLQSLKAGGFFMIPIIVCGIIATFIIIERCIYFFNTKKLLFWYYYGNISMIKKVQSN